MEDVIKKIPYQQIEDLLDEEKLVNADELEFLGKGLPVSGGVGTATICFSIDERKKLIFCRNGTFNWKRLS